MKGKKIDEYNTRKILYSNKNLFKENDYLLKNDMEFEEKNEINCQKICFYRGIPIIAIYIAYKFLYIFISLFFHHKTGKFGLLRVPLLIMYILSFILIKDVKRIISNTSSLRMFIYFIHFFDLFLFCKLTREKDDIQEGLDKIDYFFTLSTFVNTYLLIIIINYVFSLGYKKSILLLLLNNLFLLAFYGHKNCNTFKRLFLNVLSFRSIISLFYLLVTVLIQNKINKPIKKLWAMFDSFKKSYLSIRNIFNNLSLPIFIVKEDLSEIVFQNPSAVQFCHKYRRIAQKGEYTFKDIFFLDDQEDMQLFKDILKISLENNESYFLFPFCLEEIKKKKNNKNYFEMNIDINNTDDNISFMKMYCFKCKWKDKIPCYYFMINENIFTFQGGQVILSDFMQIQYELEKIMWNINTLCLNLDKKFNNKKEDFFFFYINLSLNFIYDLTSTNYIYNTFIEKKKITGYTKFNFGSFIKYLINYISVFALNKNFEIKNEIDKNDDVICNLSYIRAIVFNILLFIIENTNDQKQKTIIIKRENIKYEYKKGNYEKLIFKFTDSRPILNYETIKHYFQHFNYRFFLYQSPIDTYNMINFGILVPLLITETQYNLNDSKIKQFNVETKGNNIEISIIIFFNEINNENNFIYDKKIFPVFKGGDIGNEIKSILSKRFYIKKENIETESLLDDGKDDNLIKANEEYNLAEDKNLVNELRAKKYVIGEYNFDDIISEKNKLKNFVNKKLKFKSSNSSLLRKKVYFVPNFKKINLTITEFKKFEILRFLIIEEQSFPLDSIYNLILKSGNECNMDIAWDGYIILEKYKFIYNRRMLYDYIFVDASNNLLKGTIDALNEIKTLEKKSGIHTKIIGIQNSNKKVYNMELYDKIIPKSIKDFIDLIYNQ